MIFFSVISMSVWYAHSNKYLRVKDFGRVLISRYCPMQASSPCPPGKESSISTSVLKPAGIWQTNAAVVCCATGCCVAEEAEHELLPQAQHRSLLLPYNSYQFRWAVLASASETSGVAETTFSVVFLPLEESSTMQTTLAVFSNLQENA